MREGYQDNFLGKKKHFVRRISYNSFNNMLTIPNGYNQGRGNL